jgi:homeobox protein YOX1/YHP1
MSSTSVPKDHYYVNASSIGKSRRNSPGDSQGIPYYQTSGQGGRTVLPPFSAAFPNLPFPGPAYSNPAFTQPRSSPGRYDISAQALYSNPQWTGNSPQLEQSFSPNYDMMPSGRYSPAPSHYGYSTRGSSPPSMLSQDRQRLPPLATSSSGDRWHQSPGGYDVSSMSGYSNPNHVASIRSPNPSYANSYPAYPGGSHGDPYYMPNHDPLAINTSGQPGMFDDMRGMQPRPTSPGYRGAHAAVNNYHTPPPVSPTSPEDTTVKKKRKRADAHQLKVLNETYARTAFPSTEERHALAKALDMSARSVQIWFQNKRQSMRQTNRQANTSSSSHPAYGPTSIQSERHMEDGMGHGQVHTSGFSSGQLSLEAPYLAQDIPRSHTSQSASRRYRSPEDESHKQWRGY